MAYRRSRGKVRKLEPAVMQMEFVIPANTDVYLDLNLAASLINRRAYKQENTNWAVGKFEFLCNGLGTAAIAKLPETWIAQNAYKKSLALYNKMNDQVLEENEDIQGKYADYKVYLDTTMRGESIQTEGNPTGKIITPIVSLPNGTQTHTVASFDESASPKANWDWSTIQIPNDGAPGTTIEYDLHMVGDNTTDSMGIIDGYGLSRSRVQLEEPNTPGAGASGDWMTALFDDGDKFEEIKSDLVNDNDRPPYAVGSPGGISEFYPGGANEFGGLQLHGFCIFTATTVSNKNVIEGGMFGLGMMAIANNTDASMNMLVHMVPGEHRGYMVGDYC